MLSAQQKRCLRSSNGKSRTAHTEPLLKTMNQLKLVDMYKTKLLKFYYKLYRNQLPCSFDSFLPTYGTSHYPMMDYIYLMLIINFVRLMLNTNYTNYYVRYHIHSMQRRGYFLSAKKKRLLKS